MIAREYEHHENKQRALKAWDKVQLAIDKFEDTYCREVDLIEAKRTFWQSVWEITKNEFILHSIIAIISGLFTYFLIKPILYLFVTSRFG